MRLGRLKPLGRLRRFQITDKFWEQIDMLGCARQCLCHQMGSLDATPCHDLQVSARPEKGELEVCSARCFQLNAEQKSFDVNQMSAG